MKKFVMAAALLFFVGSSFGQNPSHTVNPLIGDESFVALFGFQPDQNTDNQLRVMAHLSYAELLLREKNTDGLTEQQKAKREKVLDLLHEYWTRGVYPANLDYPDERRPCFIDKDGNICAVGYLVEKTAGRETAQQINEKHKYDYLLDMNEPVLTAWAEEHGFTLEECATIQPMYGPPPVGETVNAPISKGYGISSGFIGGLNLAVNTINFSGRMGNARGVAFVGLVSGATQIIMGVTNIKRDRKWGDYFNGPINTESYKAQNNLSYFNIAMGTTTLVTSAINLYLSEKVRSKKNSVGLYSYPGVNNEFNIGFTVARKL